MLHIRPSRQIDGRVGRLRKAKSNRQPTSSSNSQFVLVKIQLMDIKTKESKRMKELPLYALKQSEVSVARCCVGVISWFTLDQGHSRKVLHRDLPLVWSCRD